MSRLPERVTIRYTGARAVTARGTVSGSRYQASPARPSLEVDPRDAPALIRTGLFVAVSL